MTPTSADSSAKRSFPQFRVLRRNVRGQGHRLLRLHGSDGLPRYMWLVFVSLVGSTPETAGHGPTVLASGLDSTDDVATAMKPFATVASFREVKPEIV
jgi:hypothetical protein